MGVKDGICVAADADFVPVVFALPDGVEEVFAADFAGVVAVEVDEVESGAAAAKVIPATNGERTNSVERTRSPFRRSD